MNIEQLIPGTLEWEAFYANHIFRYQFALDYLKQHTKHTILDAATGVGYGAYFLASHGINNIVAIDRNDDALNIARNNFNHHNIQFVKDDCHYLQSAAKYAPFNAIVSFETLEHLPRPDEFIKRCYALLKPGGLIIVSTPNVSVAPYASKDNWRFHEKDYTPSDLKSILIRNGFDNITLFGQALAKSGLLREELRGELNRINANPFMRFGSFLQRILRNHSPRAVLPEIISDFELVEQPDLESRPCFVIIALAVKPGSL